MPSKDPTSGKNVGGSARQFAIATELPFVIVSGAVAGGFLGYLLDLWWHTKPWMMLVLGAVGFSVGLRDVLRRVQKDDSDASSSRGS